MESLLWASECFNRSATAANDGWLAPHEIFHGSHPPLPLLQFFQPAYHRVPRQRKNNPRARLYYFLNFGYNHGHDCYKLLDAETGKVYYRATSRGTIQRRLRSLRQLKSGIRPLRHRRTSTNIPSRGLSNTSPEKQICSREVAPW